MCYTDLLRWSLHYILHVDVTVDSRHFVLLHFSINFAEISQMWPQLFFRLSDISHYFLFLHWSKCINWHWFWAKCNSFLVVSSQFFWSLFFCYIFIVYISVFSSETCLLSSYALLHTQDACTCLRYPLYWGFCLILWRPKRKSL